jgi:hypothetical protein
MESRACAMDAIEYPAASAINCIGNGCLVSMAEDNWWTVFIIESKKGP